jgi:hypothetical protein
MADSIEYPISRSDCTSAEGDGWTFKYLGIYLFNLIITLYLLASFFHFNPGADRRRGLFKQA